MDGRACGVVAMHAPGCVGVSGKDGQSGAGCADGQDGKHQVEVLETSLGIKS